MLCITEEPLRQGSPTPGPGTCTGLWPVRNRATQQEVRGGPDGKASSVSAAAPSASMTTSAPPQTIGHQILIGAQVPGTTKVGDHCPMVYERMVVYFNANPLFFPQILEVLHIYWDRTKNTFLITLLRSVLSGAHEFSALHQYNIQI
uniref:Uncharacterized protein n=1 Tax=Rousettus aegyptiacus TaxID=9407 RepID=A0A7J8C2P7_ROUAE|nr:hypothetical protein HJG63_009436 [Rousettus aegyptiacus]